MINYLFFSIIAFMNIINYCYNRKGNFYNLYLSFVYQNYMLSVPLQIATKLKFSNLILYIHTYNTSFIKNKRFFAELKLYFQNYI